MATKPNRAKALVSARTKSVASKAVVKAVVKKERSASPKERQRFTLYGTPNSGPTYTVALGLSLMRHPFSYIHLNLREGAHKQPDYLIKNRYGQVPALRDGQLYVVQSAAILMHLSESFSKFTSKNTAEKNHIREWMFWQWDKLAVPVYRLRARNRGFRQFGEEVRLLFDTEARAALAVLEQSLIRSEWVVGKKASIADISIYGVLRYAPEAHIDLAHYPHVNAWKKRFEAQPGFATPEELLPMESRLI